MITIKPYGGLCNRIRSLDSVVALTKTDQSPITVIWELSPSLNCRFEDLFEVPDFIRIVTKQRTKSAFLLKISQRLKKLVRFLGLNFPFGYAFYIYERQLKKLRESNFNFEELKKYKSVYIETQHQFYSIGEDFFWVKAIESIQERVNGIVQGYSKDTIGVHIRRTDNLKSIINSPLELFIEMMNTELSENQDAKFFLATDSTEDEKKLLELFKDRIMVQSGKQLSRNNPQAIQDALVDMLCLSKTRMIYGSFWSSFSSTAASIGRIPIVVLKK